MAVEQRAYSRTVFVVHVRCYDVPARRSLIERGIVSGEMHTRLIPCVLEVNSLLLFSTLKKIGDCTGGLPTSRPSFVVIPDECFVENWYNLSPERPARRSKIRKGLVAVIAGEESANKHQKF